MSKAKCLVDTCVNISRVGGHCNAHYLRLRNLGSLLESVPVRKFGRPLKIEKSPSAEYRVWSAMKYRCSNPTGGQFKNYGGRGIRVCHRWLKFENFLEDMGPRPKGMSIDRINNNQGYYPSNCRWATMSQQARNSRRSPTPEKVNRIRSLHRSGLRYQDIADAEDVGLNIVKAVIRGTHWACL